MALGLNIELALATAAALCGSSSTGVGVFCCGAEGVAVAAWAIKVGTDKSTFSKVSRLGVFTRYMEPRLDDAGGGGLRLCLKRVRVTQLKTQPRIPLPHLQIVGISKMIMPRRIKYRVDSSQSG